MQAFSLSHPREQSRQAFWLVPAGCVLVALGLAVGLTYVNVRARTTLLFPGGPEPARSFLSSVTTAMISVTGLVFSITIVALQLAAGQFSSRVMREFLRDRTIQVKSRRGGAPGLPSGAHRRLSALRARAGL